MKPTGKPAEIKQSPVKHSDLGLSHTHTRQNQGWEEREEKSWVLQEGRILSCESFLRKGGACRALQAFGSREKPQM